MSISYDAGSSIKRKPARCFASALLLAAVFFLVQCNSSSGGGSAEAAGLTLASAPGAKSWTVLVYMDGDNNLEGDFIDAFAKMAQYGSDANIDLVVQFDRSPDYDDRYGDWTIAHRFHVTSGMTPTENNAVTDWGSGRGGREVDMANPAELASFINWGMQNHPAERFAVVVGDHGLGWMGMCLDETSGHYWMYPRELKQALLAAPDKIDLIGLDACLMGTMDVAWQLRGVGADVMAASEASAHTWPWGVILSELVVNPGWSARDLGAWIADSYYKSYVTDQHENDMTMAALDLAEVEALGGETESFARTALAGADFQSVRDAALAVQQQVERTVIHSRASPDRDDAHGITVYFPKVRGGEVLELPDNYTFYTGKFISFARDGSWRPFLTATMETMASPLDPRLTSARLAIDQTFEGGAFVDLYHYMEVLLDQ